MSLIFRLVKGAQTPFFYTERLLYAAGSIIDDI